MQQAIEMEDKTDTERAYWRLRQAILHVEHEPNEKLKLEELKTRYNMGASPLREALARLSSEGLVVFTGGRGFRVAGISAADLRDIAMVRKLLETQALRLSIALGDDEWEAAVIAAFHKLSLAEDKLANDPSAISDWEQRNREFHSALTSAAGSPRVLELAQGMYDLHERYRRLSRLERTRSRDVHKEHRQIMEAALRRDADAACKLTEAHIDATTSRVEQMLAGTP